MTVDELLRRLSGAFPAFNAKALEAWGSVFRARLSRHEGPLLAAAFTETLGAFTVKQSKSLFPVPADFEACLPGNKKMPSGPAFDWKAHGEKYRRRATEWRDSQGRRGAKGIPEVLQALEFIALPLAYHSASAPEPLRLTTKQLKLAQHRAISFRRYHEFGPLQSWLKTDEWWSQIRTIANRWNIETTREDWEAPKHESEKAEAVESGSPAP